MGPVGTSGGQPEDARSGGASHVRLDVRAVLPTVRVPTLVIQHSDNPFVPPAKGKYIAEHIPDAKYVQVPGRHIHHIVEPWRPSFREIAEFLTGEQADVPDDRLLATVLFTDIVDSTRRAAEIGDRRLACVARCARRHRAVAAVTVSGPRGEHIGRRFPRDVRRPAASHPLRDGDRRRGAGPRHRGARRVAHWRVRGSRRRHRWDRGGHRRAGQRTGGPPRRAVSNTLRDLVIGTKTPVRRPRRSPTQGRARRMASLRRRVSIAVTWAAPRPVVGRWSTAHSCDTIRPAQRARPRWRGTSRSVGVRWRWPWHCSRRG